MVVVGGDGNGDEDVGCTGIAAKRAILVVREKKNNNKENKRKSDSPSWSKPHMVPPLVKNTFGPEKGLILVLVSHSP
uniref:Uncharacterized protein n=1 Tax=Vespula pensylvanica TaxID=30213 RepID=A0A834P3W0_VESPE|nr:hypothetical protein H0235_006590 [Vespula pensylvanica]